MINKILDTLLKWPHTPANCIAPWYILIWRALWFPIIYVGLGFTFVSLALCFGVTVALEWWKDADYY